MISARYTYDLGEARLVTAALFRTRDRYLDEFRSSGAFKEYVPGVAQCDLGVDSIAPFDIPAEDRNRTSPFPYGGHRFECVGSCWLMLAHVRSSAKTSRLARRRRIAIQLLPYLWQVPRGWLVAKRLDGEHGAVHDLR